MKRQPVAALIWIVWSVGYGAVPALADGGTLQRVEQFGDVAVAVFTAPNPLRAGTIDVSLLVQDNATGRPLGEIPAGVELAIADGRSTPIRVPLLRANATNRLMQSALIELPASGTWDATLQIELPDGAVRMRVPLTVEPPLAPWLTEWTWFSWPAAAVALFAVHRYRASHRAGRGSAA